MRFNQSDSFNCMFHFWTDGPMYVCMYTVCMQKLETDNLLRTLWCILMAFCFVSLTMHLSITLANDQLDAQIFNTFITILYTYMFRAISCSSSGGKIVLMQHLVSSPSVSDHPVHRLRKNLCTRQSLTESDNTRCCINTILPLEDEQDIARNMYV